MNFVQLTIGEREFECRLSTKDTVMLERKLGTNPLNIFIAAAEGQMPSMEAMLTVMTYAAKEDGKKHNLDTWFDLYDEYLAEGNSIADFLQLTIEILQVSGIMPKEEDVKELAEGK